jgi:hypothetical protein
MIINAELIMLWKKEVTHFFILEGLRKVTKSLSCEWSDLQARFKRSTSTIRNPIASRYLICNPVTGKWCINLLFGKAYAT